MLALSLDIGGSILAVEWSETMNCCIQCPSIHSERNRSNHFCRVSQGHSRGSCTKVVQRLRSATELQLGSHG